MRKWLAEAREKKGLTQKEIAERCGISAPSYNNIETGKYNPAVKNAKRIAKVLGVKWTRFYEEA